MIKVDELPDKLESLEAGSAVALKVDVDVYFDVITALTDDFPRDREMQVIYTTSTISSSTIIKVLNAFDIDRDRVQFVDAVSYMTMGAAEKEEGVTFVESPTMLENLSLKIEYLLRKYPTEENTVVLDSIDSLAIHNENRILSEFLHILISSLRSHECFTFILSVSEQDSEEIDNMLAMVCDDFIEVGNSEEKEEEELV
ncbi:MAG: hypothetical protein KGY76_05225 [Candidatus Thermoplasmatota archaeon]|nr:hypothetical protein [Candidatus Thermoplasmatota archaeon]